MSTKVFISSTKQDLEEHRAAVVHALLDFGFHPIDMDNFMAQDEEPQEACLQEVAQSELFVGIYACRYGFIPEGSQISITERELVEATRQKRPRFLFLIDESHPWPDKYREQGRGAALLRDLKERLIKQRMRTTFTTPEDLARKVTASLHRHVMKAAVSPERRDLLLLLEKVERNWIRRVLEKSAPDGRRIDLDLEECADVVELPFLAWKEAEEDADSPESSAEAILDLFLDRDQSLLILGEGDSGKTTTLLLLARGLCDLAWRNPQAAIPVVFHLASWNGQPSSLSDWLVEELASSYKTGREAARTWLQNRQILPLLDGLDEVQIKHRRACAEALNAFLDSRGLWGIAVCCRIKAYKKLKLGLKLSAAICLQPLTRPKVDEYLATAGPGGDDLRSALDEDEGLRELSKSPLFLSLMAQQAAKEASSQALRQGAGTPIAERRRKLLGAYVDRSLKWRTSPRYPPERILPLLAWLARRMVEHNAALFQLEQLQPSWLEKPADRWFYALTSRGIAGLLIALPVAMVMVGSAAWLLAFGWLAGVVAGIIDAIGLRRSAPGGLQAGLLRSVVHLVFFGTSAFFLFLLPALWLADRATTAAAADSLRQNGRVGGLLFALLFGLILGLRSAQRDRRSDIQTAEALTWSRWSWRGMRRGAVAGALVGVAANMLAMPDPTVDSLAIFGSLLPVAGLLVGGLFGGLKGRTIEKEEKPFPNMGIQLTLTNTRQVALVATLLTLLSTEAVFLSLWLAARAAGKGAEEIYQPYLWLPLLWGPMCGFWIGLWFSGLDFLQHWVLRAFLRLRGHMPSDFVPVLDDAAACDLLHKVGGSYLFFHGQPLLDHFASLPAPADEPREAAG